MRLLRLVLSAVVSMAFVIAPSVVVQPATAAQFAAVTSIERSAQSVVEAENYSATTRSTLRQGSRGSDVQFLQSQLNRHGYALKEDGIFGVGTASAVRSYQSTNGLVPDGIVGSATWSKLGVGSSQPAATPSPSTPSSIGSPTLKYGAKEPAVRELQRLLQNYGYYPKSWSLDESFGIGTANAVLNYQQAQGLSDDAVVGPATWARLRLNPQPPVIRSGVPAEIRAVPGVVLFVDNAQDKLFFQRDGQLIRTFSVRLGGFTRVENKAKPDYGQYRNHPTVRRPKKGQYYKVYDKDINPSSAVYGEGAMPYSVMFDPNMYVHYSADFAKYGYSRSSHGCVNVSNKDDARWIFENTPLEAKVYVW